MIDYDGLQKHREKMKQDILDLLKTEQRVACVQPTGIGKSHCIAQLCNELKGKKLVLEPGTAVIDYMQEFSIDTPDTTYITYHSLLRPSIEDLAKYFKEYDYIFLDEMHRALAEKWGKQLEKVFTVLDNIKANYKILGFSATPIRSDNRDVVEEIFKGVQTEPYYLQDAILDGILPNIEYHSSIYEIIDKDRNKLKLKDTPLAQQILRYNIDEGVSEIFKENLDLSQSHRIIVFVDKISNIEEAIFNVKKWLNINFSVYKVHSKIAEEKNLKTINDFQNDRNLAIMFAVNILNEGVHLNKVDTVIFLRKTSSNVLYNQQLGRIVADTIENPKVFDLVNNIDNLDNGYASIFKERANQLGVRTEQLVTKNGEYLKITTHQEDLIEKLKYIVDFIRKDNYTLEERNFIINHSEMTIRQMRDNINALFKTNRSMQSVRGFCKKNFYKYKSELRHLTEKDKIYIKNHPEMTDIELEKILGVSHTTISSHRRIHLGRNTRTYLSDEQKEFIRNNSYKYTIDEMMNICNITVTRQTLQRYLNKNNYDFISSKKFTVNDLSDSEKAFIVQHYGKDMTKKEISRALHHNDSVIREYINIKNLCSENLSDEQKEFIRNNSYKYTVKEMSDILNVATYRIYSFCTKNNLNFKRVNKRLCYT